MKKFFLWLILMAISGEIGFALGSAESTHRTESMYPTMRPGVYALINPLERHPDPGDIVGFRCYQKCYYPFVEHRVTAVSPEGCYWIVGDNQPIAWDSNDYGWLCPGKDIWIIGTTVRLGTLDEIKSNLIGAL